MEPDVLLIDEPSAGLAPNTADDVFEDVQEVNDMDTAILMVEQNVTKGLGISDRGYVLDQGTVGSRGRRRNCSTTRRSRSCTSAAESPLVPFEAYPTRMPPSLGRYAFALAPLAAAALWGGMYVVSKWGSR